MAFFELNDWPWLVEFVFGLFLLGGVTQIVKVIAFAWIETVRIQYGFGIDAEPKTKEDTEETVIEEVERQEADELGGYAERVANDDEDYPEHVEE
jgi:hypothetical protein